jgi:hypothetical protein
MIKRDKYTIIFCSVAFFRALAGADPPATITWGPPGHPEQQKNSGKIPLSSLRDL